MHKLFLLAAALLLTACSTSFPTDGEKPTNTTKEAFNYWPQTEPHALFYQIEKITEDAFTGEYPVVQNLAADHPLSVALAVYPQQVAAAQKEQQAWFNELKESGDDIPTSGSYDYSVAWLGGRYHPELWSLAFQVYQYSGGAHGNHWTDTYNYHVPSQKILTLSDLFTGESVWQNLSDALTNALTAEKQKRLASWSTDTEAPIAYEPSEDPFLEGFTFDQTTLNHWVAAEQNQKAGLLFFFAPYELGPYAEGSYELFVPMSTFADELKPEFEKIFE